MVFTAAPTVAGIYHVKAFNTGNNQYWKYRDTGERWIELNAFQDTDEFKFEITPIPGQAGRITIKPVAEQNIHFSVSDTKNKYSQHGFARGVPIGRHGIPSPWKVVTSPNQYSKLSCLDHPTSQSYVLDSQYGSGAPPDRCVHFWNEDPSAALQRWVFEFVPPKGQITDPKKNGGSEGSQQGKNGVNGTDGRQGSSGSNPNAKSFEKQFFSYTAAEAATRDWDIVVIGTGIGGGIIAGDLFDSNSRLGRNAKKVLVIEKGGLVFHSHCLNASRPAGFSEDAGQQNDTFFALFKDQFTFPTGKSADWAGGAMYNLGGRSAAWGLFAPRIHDEALKQHFGGSVPRNNIAKALTDTWYSEAEKLMSVSLPTTNAVQQNVIERINMMSDPKFACQWQWGRIASEFNMNKNFDFAKGAYSPIDKLLEIAMSKRRVGGKYVEHENWSILLNTEARSIAWASAEGVASGEVASGVVVRDADGKEHTIRLRDGGKVVLAAGSVHSPAILMRSGKTDFLQQNNGLHLTDHDLFAKTYTFQYTNPAQRADVGAMKLQTYVTLPSSNRDHQHVALCNVSIDASSFLPRETLPNEFFRNEDYPKLIFAFITETRLNPSNTITLDDKDEPVVICDREVPFSNSAPDVAALRSLTRVAKNEVRKALGIQYINEADDDDTFFAVPGLGCVAHELGTIPFQGARDQKFCLNSDLSLALNSGTGRGRGTPCGVYVADLSIFPHSPEVNPTLTLAALALRLSRTELLPRALPAPSDGSFAPGGDVPPDVVWVMNQTGEKIKIFISNYAGAPKTDDDQEDVLEPGQDTTRRRKAGSIEAVAVYRLQYNSDKLFLPTPVLYQARAGELTPIAESPS